MGSEEDCRKATSYEIAEFIKALKEEAASNPEARKVLKEVFNIEVRPVIRTYQDLIDKCEKMPGYFIAGGNSTIVECKDAICTEVNKNVAATEKVAKSMLAMISQLMPYYGGAITDEEWANDNILKYRIVRVGNHMSALKSTASCSFLSFHTEEQRDNFLKYNKQLVKDYLMIN